MALDDLKLTFRDEFNSLSLDTGTAVTDANFWNTSMYNGYVRTLEGNGELQWYVDADYKGAASTPLGVNPFEVNNGVLSIKARMASTQVRNSLWGYAYTSGVLTSAGEFSQQYGYFEVRAQVPEGKGLWPAFWLLADDNSWPPELDVMEVVGDSTNYVHQTTHTGAGVNQGEATWNTEKLSAGFHTYGMDWTASTITYYLDGKATLTMATPADLHTPMYMLLNLAVGGNWPGDPDDNMDWSTANYNVDYVRVYQHTGVSGSGGLLPVSDGATGGATGGTTGGGTGGGSGLPSSGTGQLIASNGLDVSGATGARYQATDTGANSSRTYTAAEMGLSGVPASATMTVAYDAQKNMTISNNGAWNDIKNAAVTSATTSGVTVNNFVAVQVTLTNNQNNTVSVTDAKRGNIVTGAGNDTINVFAKSDTNDINMMTIAAGDGANRISFNGAANTRTTITAGSGADVITVTGATSAAIQTGGGADIIRGGTGNDVINAGDGDDTLNAGFSDGNDTYAGGNGWDTLDYSGVAGVVQINQLDGITTGSAGNDVLADVIEQIIGSSYNDVLSGGHGVNCLDGGGGDDMLYGNGGDDLLRGGDGDDAIVCNLLNDGNDRFQGGNGWDVLDYALLGGAVQVDQLNGRATGSAGNDTFLDTFEQIVGSNYDDILAGGHGVNCIDGGGGGDMLYGNGGDDLLRGGDGDDAIVCNLLNDGNDRFQGGNGWDVLDYALLGGAVQVDQLNGRATGSAGNDTFLDTFEQIVGSNYDDILAGGHGVNCIDGGGGDDMLYGNGGDDLLRGGDGNDTIVCNLLNDGNDRLQGGNGFDTVDYSLLSGAVQVNLAAGTAAGTAGNDAFLDSFERIIGSNFADILIGDNNANTLLGGGGNDTINGGGGDDFITGGGGDNILVGGAGRDIFAFVAGAHATITDFNVAEDRIELPGVSASSLTVRTSGNSTLIDLNGNTVMTLSGITVSSNAINFM